MGNQTSLTVHNEYVLSNLNPGDLVEFPRGVYSHWAVYQGNGDVVHRPGVGNSVANISASSFSSCGDVSNKAKVCIENFWEVAAGSRARINNGKHRNWRALSGEEVVRNALSQVGDVGYNVLSSNCEHFAKRCRYGISHSDQADHLMMGGAIVLAVGLVLAPFALAKIMKKNKKKKKVATRR